ncbi:MAG: hypothetical protein LBI79_04000 [Nitrososphaerota archaeon]|nr:hypothetical protein [Nitrososphaerota archaeon]
MYDWQVVELELPVVEGWKRYLLVRRGKVEAGEEGELRAHVCFAPRGVSVLRLVEVAGVRWTVECCFAESKSLVGLDEYEVQSYVGWYRHVTFACLAYALLSVLSCVSLGGKAMVQYEPLSGSLSVFKKKRGLRG